MKNSFVYLDFEKQTKHKTYKCDPINTWKFSSSYQWQEDCHSRRKTNTSMSPIWQTIIYVSGRIIIINDWSSFSPTSVTKQDDSSFPHCFSHFMKISIERKKSSHDITNHFRFFFPCIICRDRYIYTSDIFQNITCRESFSVFARDTLGIPVRSGIFGLFRGNTRTKPYDEY